MARIIGIDYGEKRVGVALSDDGCTYAFAKEVLPNNNQLLDALATLALKEQVERFVVGGSDNPVGGMNTIMRRITIFSEALQVRTGLPVSSVSEAYSSAYARRALETGEKTRKERVEYVDSAAAAIILQTYLDTMQRDHGGVKTENKT
jgi:putative Holliday junction resolvase